jgi:hypothetical protein
VRKFFAIPVVALGIVAAWGTAASAHECYNASKPAGAGAQIILGEDADGNETFDAKQGVIKRIEKGIIDLETGEGFHGILGFDEDGDGVADGHTYIVGPNGELPLTAQLRGSTDHGINNLCGPTGCE